MNEPLHLEYQTRLSYVHKKLMINDLNCYLWGHPLETAQFFPLKERHPSFVEKKVACYRDNNNIKTNEWIYVCVSASCPFIQKFLEVPKKD